MSSWKIFWLPDDVSRSKVCSIAVMFMLAQGSMSAIGATLELDVKIEGVGVTAMVDTGSQSSIISRTVLHMIGGR